MDRAYIDKHLIVDRYLMDQLTDEQKQDFEMTFLDDPELLDELEMVAAMRGGLEIAGGRLREGADSRQSSGKWQVGWASGTVFGIVAFVAVGSAFFTYSSLQQRPSMDIAALPSADVWLEPLRNGSDRMIEISTVPVPLRIDIGPEPRSTYEVVIEGGRESFSAEGLRPDQEDSLRILLPALPTGTYTIRLVATSEDGVRERLATYTIRILDQ